MASLDGMWRQPKLAGRWVVVDRGFVVAPGLTSLQVSMRNVGARAARDGYRTFVARRAEHGEPGASGQQRNVQPDRIADAAGRYRPLAANTDRCANIAPTGSDGG
jgi:hypothetical protein